MQNNTSQELEDRADRYHETNTMILRPDPYQEIAEIKQLILDATRRLTALELRLAAPTNLALTLASTFGVGLDVAEQAVSRATESTPVDIVQPAPVFEPTLNDEWRSVLERLNDRSIPAIFVTGNAGCLSGDTVIEVNRAGKSYKLLLADLYYRQNGGVAGGKTFDPRIVTKVRSEQNGIVALNALDCVVYSGEKKTYTLKTADGHSIRATSDHRFLTLAGWKRLNELNPGDLVVCDAGKSKKGRAKKPYYDYTNGLNSHPFSVKNGKQSRRVPTHRLVFEAGLNGLALDQFVARIRSGEGKGLRFVDPATHTVHHIDGNYRNNSLGNLQMMTNVEHRQYHSTAGWWTHVQSTTKTTAVVSIEDYGIEPTYDITMSNQANPNFLANGLVVHNSGKTTLMQYFARNYDGNLAIVAPTGVAALRAGGQTIHSFFGFSINVMEPDDIRVVSGSKRHKYQRLDTLIVDEGSMVNAYVFDQIDWFLRKNGPNKDKPFGGVRIIVFGDLFQLPPVYSEKAVKQAMKHRYGLQEPFFFHSEAARGLDILKITLTTNYRQNDSEFVGALNAIRTGAASRAQITLLNSRVNPGFNPPAGENWIELTTTNDDADRINRAATMRLTTPAKTFTASVSGTFGPDKYPTDHDLNLKVGLPVMFIKNGNAYLGQTWHNGTLGVVRNLDPLQVDVDGLTMDVSLETWENGVYEWDERKKRLTREIVGEFVQVPLRVAAAVTIHKSQGLTLDRVIINMGRRGAFASGQTYVAFSRCRTLAGIVLRMPLREDDLMVNSEVVKRLAGEEIAKPETVKQSNFWDSLNNDVIDQ